MEIGATIRSGHYRQEGISFDEQTRVIDMVKSIADVVQMSNGEKVTAAHFLNYFMFPYPMHQQFAYKLSGGEKRRLYLVTVLTQNPNFLILDEPTNDLDILTLNILEEYLASFQGCVLVVTHDRFFLDKIVDHLFVFSGNAVMRDFPGNYSQYREYAERAKQKQHWPRQRPKRSRLAGRPPKQVRPGLTYKEKVEFGSLETLIGRLEKEKSELEAVMAPDCWDQAELTEKSNRFSDSPEGN